MLQWLRDTLTAIEPFSEEEQQALEIGDRLLRGEEVEADEVSVHFAQFMVREEDLDKLTQSLRIKAQTFIENMLFPSQQTGGKDAT